MTSILILENQEPGDCATCPMFSRYAGICHLTLKFAGEGCPLRKLLKKEEDVPVFLKDGSVGMYIVVEVKGPEK